MRKSVGFLLIIMFADAVGLAIPSIIVRRNFFHYYTALTLVESGVLFFVGGLVDISGSISFTLTTYHLSKSEKGWNERELKQTQLKAVHCIVTGILLFVISFILGYPLN
jgi:hypothetical protein